MSDYVIRTAEPADLEAAGRVTLNAYATDGHAHEGEGYDVELLDAAARASKAELLVAVDADDQVIGTVTFCRAGTEFAEISRPGEAEFRMLGVTPEARGRGIGEALVRACIDLAGQHRDTALVLSTLPAMNGAHRIYERLGFRRIPERDWWPTSEVELIAYQLDL